MVSKSTLLAAAVSHLETIVTILVILVELKNYQYKSNILENKHKLRKITSDKIYINEDTTRKERKSKTNKKNGKKYSYSKVIIEGE